jgi:glycosyltransferase involved in cell wall biosynthesis
MTQKTGFSSPEEKRVAYLSTYPPRECGIATFTKDLVDAIEELDDFRRSVVIAINEKGTIYDYDQRVKFQVKRDSVEDYVQAAEYVNSSRIDLVNIQHEFGIFGGEWGAHIIAFLENLRKPAVTTLHTVEPEFPFTAQEVLKNIASHSAAVVIMAKVAAGILKGYGVPDRKMSVIYHGCPDIQFVPSDSVKPSLGLKGRTVLSTSGLMSRSKGIEYVIQALPPIVNRYPNVLYLVIGETHPEVRKTEGENYRKKLMRLVDELGLEEYVRFHNRFLTKRELIRYLQATDIYVTPYVSPNQVSSGTLIYAVGAGKAIISTPYLQAREVLADGRGLLCKFRNPSSITECVERLLTNGAMRRRMEARVYRYGRDFVWESVAKKYCKLFKSIIVRRRVRNP